MSSVGCVWFFPPYFYFIYFDRRLLECFSASILWHFKVVAVLLEKWALSFPVRAAFLLRCTLSQLLQHAQRCVFFCVCLASACNSNKKPKFNGYCQMARRKSSAQYVQQFHLAADCAVTLVYFVYLCNCIPLRLSLECQWNTRLMHNTVMKHITAEPQQTWKEEKNKHRDRDEKTSFICRWWNKKKYHANRQLISSALSYWMRNANRDAANIKWTMEISHLNWMDLNK